MKSSEEQLGSACSQLADWLQSNAQALINDWVVQVSEDSVVPSESMTKPEIIDHVPQIFDEINHALRQQSSTTMQIHQFAARHTIVRWAQGYDLKGVLREISLLRTVFNRHSRAFEDQCQHISSDERIFVSTIIHRILDDVVMDATDTFLKLQARASGNEA